MFLKRTRADKQQQVSDFRLRKPKCIRVKDLSDATSSSANTNIGSLLPSLASSSLTIQEQAQDIYEENDKWTSQLIEVTDLMSDWEIYKEVKNYNNQIKPMEIIEETKIEEITEEINKIEDENKEETWSKDSKQNMTTEIPDVFKDLINLDF